MLLGSVLAFASFSAMHGQGSNIQRPGPLQDGGTLLPNGWTVRPAGEQIPVDTLPMGTSLSPGGKFLLVLNAGYRRPSISVINVATRKVVSHVSLPDAWLGLRFLQKGNKVYVGGGSTGVADEFSFDDATGVLTPARTFSAIADPNGSANKQSGDTFIGDVAVSPDDHLLYAADLLEDRVLVFNLQTGSMTASWKCGRRPYRLLLLPGGNQLVVSSWADASIYQYNAHSGDLIARNRVSPHPTDMVYLPQPVAAADGEGGAAFSGRLFVAASNTNGVYTFGVTKEGTFQQLESLDLALSATQPLGMTPSALALNSDGTRLFAVCSDGNTVAVADLTDRRTRIAGFIPTGWYPTSVTLLPDNSLAITNGKGLRGTESASPPYEEPGSVNFVPDLSEDQLRADTQIVLQNGRFQDNQLYSASSDGQATFFSKTDGHPSPVKHVVYLLKGSRSYGEIFGDRSGPGLGDSVTPNEHALGSQFVRFSNFYSDGDGSVDGLNWASAAIAPSFTVKLAPNWESRRLKSNLFEGGEFANLPPAGYLWDNALQAGLSVRSYGIWTVNTATKAEAGQQQIAKVNDPSLVGKVDLNFRGFDSSYPDVERAHEFIKEWRALNASGQLPDLTVLRLGNDSAAGSESGAHTTAASVADNDAAVGQIVDALSHSDAWSSTAIFIAQQSGTSGYHVPAFVVSPWTGHNTVDSNMYDGASMLRTIEMLLGLHPMTQFDAAAKPMFNGFSQQPNVRPFVALAPQSSISDRNLRGTPTPSE